ncbi:MAG: tripartite tricarboxylate transporter substrate binding protein [Devosia sp.]|nr:tripartite tricarboxylate transporter substrate binding protein [Devosia sp.]
MNKRHAMTLVAAAALSALAAGSATAAYPDKPVRFIVPYTSGGAADIVARKLALRMADQLGQPVVVENKPGANTVLGAMAVAKAEKDGYTLLFVGGSTFLQPMLNKNTPYQTSDFTPISLVGKFPFVLITRGDLGASNPKEFADIARAKPGGLTYGHTGVGTTAHLLGEMIFQTMGVPVKGVPYKGGSQAMADLVGGHIDASLDALVTSVPAQATGKVRIVGTLGAERSPLAPAVPTFAESGYPSLTLYSWTALFAPAGTPAAVIERINGAVQKSIANEEFRKQLIDGGQVPSHTTPAQTSKFIADDMALWGPFIKKLGIQE